MVLPEALVTHLREGRRHRRKVIGRAGVRGGGGHYQGNIRKLWGKLFADSIQPPNTSKQMAARHFLRAASCSTVRGPSLVGSPNTSRSVLSLWHKMVGKGLGRCVGVQEG